jgi:hypothetical protein
MGGEMARDIRQGEGQEEAELKGEEDKGLWEDYHQKVGVQIVELWTIGRGTAQGHSHALIVEELGTGPVNVGQMEIMGGNREVGETTGGDSSLEDTWPGITGNKEDMGNSKGKETTGGHKVGIIKGKDNLGEHKGRRKAGWDLTIMAH